MSVIGYNPDFMASMFTTIKNTLYDFIDIFN